MCPQEDSSEYLALCRVGLSLSLALGVNRKFSRYSLLLVVGRSTNTLNYVPKKHYWVDLGAGWERNWLQVNSGGTLWRM